MISQPDIPASFEPITHLKKGARDKDPAVIKQVAKQFESLFVQMMLKSMRDTLPENELFGSNAERMYQDMYDKQMSLQISNGRGIGLANVIERQLGGAPDNETGNRNIDDYLSNPVNVPVEVLLKSSEVKHAIEKSRENFSKQFSKQSGVKETLVYSPEDYLPETHSKKTTLNVMPVNENKGAWQSSEKFINDVWPHALKASKKLGVDAEVLMAQSALETGWGKHLPLKADGTNSFNLFGIKADQRWQGEKVEITTREYRHGVMQHEKSEFRAYGSVAEAFEDYTNFIMNSPRYQQALEHGYDGDAYARELQKAGYATDPDYANKIKRVKHNEALQARVSELQSSGVTKT